MEKQIKLERPSVERFEAAYNLYVSTRSLQKIKQVIGYGALGAAALGGCGYLLYKTFSVPSVPVAGTSSEPSKTTTEPTISTSEVKKPEGFFKEFRKALMTTLAFSVSAVLIETMWSMISGTGGYLKKFFSSGGPKVYGLAPLHTALVNSVKRLKTAIQELHRSDRSQWIGEYYVSEIVSAQRVFVYSLESISAILLWKAKQSTNSKAVMLSDCRDFIKRLFFFCNKVADMLERDLAKEQWNGFEQETFNFISVLEKVSFSFINDYAQTS